MKPLKDKLKIAYHRILKFNFLNLKPVQYFLQLTKKIVIPGFDGLPLYDVARFFYQGISKGFLASRASSIAFSFFLALFPMIIVFFTMIPFIPITDFQDLVLTFINNIIPDQAEVIVQSTVVDIIQQPRGELLSLTFFLAVVFATNGIDTMIDAFNDTFHGFETRTWFKQRLISTLLFFIISFILILSIVLLIASSFFLDFLVDKRILTSIITINLLVVGKWVILIGMFFFMISFIYYLGPAKSIKFKFISPGSSLATFLTLLATIGFNYYVSNFSSYNALYGSIGTLLMVLVWIYFNAFILLIGFELNASIHSAGKENHIS